MRHDRFLVPLSETLPCGPDLDEEGDDAYLNYVMRAENQLPQRYLSYQDSPEGVLFDATKIDLKNETKVIHGLLDQSRDLRLLTLEARFQALSGQIEGFSDCVQAMAALLSTYWDDVHPKGYEGDFTLRQNTVSALDARATVIAALEYAPVLRDQRAGPITLHGLAIAKGNATAREGEPNLDLNQITETLRSERNRTALDAMHASILACQKAVESIRASFDEGTQHQFSPDFEVLPPVLKQLAGLIELGRPDLAGEVSSDEESVADDGGDLDADSHGQATVRSASGGVKAGSATISSRQDATAALLAAEAYFARHEPSSPALILVHQARLLVGQSLVVALESLLPITFEHAAIVVDSQFGFEFGMAKMRSITDDYSSTLEQIDETSENPTAFSVETRQQANAMIGGVAAFFRISEPSSPIPLLLGRAERFLNQNFQAILADLLPKKTSE